MKRFFRHIAYLFSFLVSAKVLNALWSVKINLYTGFYKRFFGAFGEDSLIVPKLRSIVGADCIQIGNNCVLGKNAKLCVYKKDCSNKESRPQLLIGNGTEIGDNVHITCISRIVIGNNVLMGSNVLITDNSHGTTQYNELRKHPVDRELFSRGEVYIEDDVWISEKASIMPGVRIGRGSVIGANTVVTKNIPPYSVVVGQASRIL